MARRSGSKSSRMTSVPLTSIGSGAKVLDLFPLPLPIFVAIRMVWWTLRHWWLFAIIMSLVFLESYQTAIIFFSLPIILFTYMYVHNPHHSPAAVARAALQLSRTRLRWRRACEAGRLNEGLRRPRLISLYPPRPPRIVNDRGTALEFTLNLARIGATTQDLEEGKEYIAAVLNARRTRVHRLTPGTAKFIVEWEKNIRRSAVANPANLIHNTQLPKVELDEDVFLELDTSLLVVGESGSGKSNLTWVMLNELNKHHINYRVYVIDPKKVELAELVDSPFTVAYSDSSKTADEVIDKFHKEMMRTFEEVMKPRSIRKIMLDENNPLNILIIDELLLCKQAKQGIDTPLGEILSAGRAAGFIVIGDSQLGQVDAISRIRDLFPQRICMATKSADMTNAVLGPHAEARGARCTEITERGVGYVFTDFTGTFQRFHPPFIEDISGVSRGNVWHEPHTPGAIEQIRDRANQLGHRKSQRCYVYRLYDSAGILLYVGKALNPNKRIPQHRDQPFWEAIDHGRTVIKKYPSEQAAFEAEQEAIENEHPRYNLMHRKED